MTGDLSPDNLQQQRENTSDLIITNSQLQMESMELNQTSTSTTGDNNDNNDND